MNLDKNDDDVAAQQLISPTVLTHQKMSLNLRKQFTKYLKLKYCNNEKAIDVNEQKEFEYVFNLGLVQSKNLLFTKESPLLHKGKKPRQDVWYNLGKIASEFINCNSHLVIPSNYLSKILNKSLGDRDSRVIRDYRKTVLYYCNVDEMIIDRCHDSRLGELDVTFFVSLIPKQYLTTSSTSSFDESVEN